ncbi:MAG: hypothetical protein K2F87_04280 [Muribaculaceae bacterium]|nr:hypothetical protein [Muribaculaceae bacterium]
MRKEDILLEKIGRKTGMTVPEGYFEAFSQQMMQKLPEYPEAPRPHVLSTWQRIKPYVYLAAMFAGIWCMMKMFHMASQGAGGVQLDNPPEAVVLALDGTEVSDYLYHMDQDDINGFEVQSDLSEHYDNIDDFAADFGYQLEPEYASMEIPTDHHT